MVKKSLLLFITAAALLWVGVAQASLNFYPTGVDDAFARLPGGSDDPHYTLAPEGAIGPYPQAVVMSESNYWFSWPNPPDAGWLYTADVGDSGARGYYVYRTTIDLTGYDPATIHIWGDWTCDNDGAMYLNGNYTGFSRALEEFDMLVPFSITSGFQAGVNTLEFRVNLLDGWDGLILSNTHITSGVVPLPGALFLLGSGLLSMVVARVRRK